MTEADAAPMSSRPPPALLGRERELERLERSLAQVVAGRGECTFIIGELGVGTSALAERACVLAEARGSTLLRGRAWPQGGGVAYGPILAAVGLRLRAADADRRAELVEGLDDLGRLFPWLAPSPPAAVGDDALGKSRLLEAFVALLDRLTRTGPVLLCIDDLHDADPATFELIQYLAQAAAGMPLWVVATVRASAASKRLRLLITWLEQAHLAATLTPEPLDTAQTRALIEARLDVRASAELVRLIDERARGLPLFLHATLTQLEQSGELLSVDGVAYPAKGAEATLPVGLRGLFDASLASLSPSSRALVELLAVAGESLSHALVSRASDLDEPALSDAIADLRARDLIVERGEGLAPAYRLTQPLAADAIHDGLSETARRRLHQRLIDAHGTEPNPDLAQLAHHHRGLGLSTAEPERSSEILLAAAKAAQARFAHRERAQWLSAAAALQRDLGHETALLRTLVDLGQAWRDAGEPNAAVEVWREALSLSSRDAGGVLDLVWGWAALAAWDARRFEECETLLCRGAESLEPRGPSAALARLYLAMLTIRARLGDRDRVEALVQTMAQPSFLALSGASEFQIRLARFHLEQVRGDYARAMAAARYAAEVAQEPAQRFRAQYVVAGGALLHGHLDDAELALAQIEALLSEDALAIHRPMLSIFRAVVARLAGRWDDASAALHEALATSLQLGGPLGGSRWTAVIHATRAGLLALQGDLLGADEELQHAAATTGVVTEPMAAIVPITRVMIHLESDDLDAAVAVAAEMERIAVAPEWESLRAEALIRGGRLEAGELTARALSGSTYADALSARLQGIAAAARGDSAAAHAGFTRALGGFGALKLPFEAARARLERAALRAQESRHAIDDARCAAATFGEIGAGRYAQRAAKLLEALGVKTPRKRRARGNAELSPRELEVARLAVSGLTNAEVAKRLFLSPHTIAAHIKRIYTRLDVSSRKALAQQLKAGGALEEDE